jgi:hypothetical protein
MPYRTGLVLLKEMLRCTGLGGLVLRASVSNWLGWRGMSREQTLIDRAHLDRGHTDKKHKF